MKERTAKRRLEFLLRIVSHGFSRTFRSNVEQRMCVALAREKRRRRTINISGLNLRSAFFSYQSIPIATTNDRALILTTILK